jgi:mRNA (guanine-N7-)-methyltransferase
MSNYISSKNHITQTQKERSQSYFYELRRYHNSIKRTLYDTYTKNIDNLLEIAAGKGSDLNKWVSNRIKHVVGYDIDLNSIEEGKRRLKATKGYTPKVELNVLDLSRNVITPTVPFDVVSAMFCFHYFFESEQTFNTIISSIKSNLKSGGIFMGTMFDGDSLLHLKVPESDTIELSDQGEVRFKLNFLGKSYQKESPFGNKLSVFIKDTVLDEPMDEYIVKFDSFVKLMKSNGFELIDSKMFESFYEPYVNAGNKALNSLQKEVSFLNRTFVFKYGLSRPNDEYKSVTSPVVGGLNPHCKQETDYLTECDWSSEQLNMIILYKYMKAFDNKIKISNEENKEKLLYIKINFLNPDEILNKETVSNDIKDYYKYIHNMYIKDLGGGYQASLS